MDIPLYFLETVSFLEIKNGEFFDQIGTVFMLNFMEGENAFMYLVTCRHVIRDLLNQNEQIYVRANLVEEPRVAHIPLHNGWVYHEDSRVDLAVLPIVKLETPVNAKILSLPSDLIYGREGMRKLFKRDVQVGDDVLFIGLFEHYPGHSKNYPLVRFGKVALVTDEEFPGIALWLGTSQYFLVECQAYPKMSGSPVFAMKEYNGQEKYFLIGVMAGYFDEDDELNKKFTHYGISQVIPIVKLGDIIWGEILKADRTKKLAEGYSLRLSS